jgi:hypothetical protein
VRKINVEKVFRGRLGGGGMLRRLDARGRSRVSVMKQWSAVLLRWKIFGSGPLFVGVLHVWMAGKGKDFGRDNIVALYYAYS